jgi:hypothetical protein
LVEAVAAMGLIVAVVGSVTTALAAGRAIATRAREQAIGRVAAQTHVATLTSLRFDTIAGADGAPLAVTDTTTDVSRDPPGPAGTGLQPSPADALWVDRPGYVDYLDANGRGIGADAPARARAAYVRRWAIGRVAPGAAGELASIAVLVAPRAVALRAAGGDPAHVVYQPGVAVHRGARSRHGS